MDGSATEATEGTGLATESTLISDLEQSVLNTLIARRGATADEDMIETLIAEALESLTPEDILRMAQDDPSQFLMRQPSFVGTVETPAEMIKQNCREYLSAILAMKLDAIDNDDVVDPSDRQV